VFIFGSISFHLAFWRGTTRATVTPLPLHGATSPQLVVDSRWSVEVRVQEREKDECEDEIKRVLIFCI
jgi:hypothetical protein